jgi:hypothetical protein
MSIVCKCDCHCTCPNRARNEQKQKEALEMGESYFVAHRGDCDLFGHQQSACCDKCKQLPDNFTFDDLCFHSHVLRCLYKQAKHWAEMVGRKKFCANAVWYSTMKPILLQEVGYGAHNRKLSGSRAYNVASDVIYNALPDCNHDGCVCGYL